MPARRRVSPCVAAALSVALLSVGTPVFGQVNTDPATAPIPTFETDNTERALVVELQFEGPTDVTVLSVDWASVPPPANVGNPPQYLAQVFDDQGLAQQFDFWNPLWSFVTTSDGHETVVTRSSATALVAFLLRRNLVELRVFAVDFDPDSDEETNTLLATADLRPAIASFCAANPDHPECEGFEPPNTAPAVAAGDPIGTTEGAAVTVTATFTDANPGDTHAATIAWGDGTAPQPAAVAAGAVSGTHVYADDGVYTATIAVTDSAGNVGEDTVTIAVVNASPVVDAGSDQTIDTGGNLILNVSFTDPGTADTHTATVDWGDGSPPEPVQVAETPFGPPGSTSGASGTVMASHVYAGAGIRTVTVTVVDDDGANGTDTMLVDVVAAAPNRPPLADAGGPYLGAVNTPVALTASASSDPDVEPLTYAWTAMAGTFTGADTAAPAFTASAAGIYTVRLEVCDPHGLCDTAESSVVVYDPTAGFVTGGGWIESSASACGPAAPADICAGGAGRADFSFVIRYHRGGTVPDGEIRFAITAANLRFESDSYEWLVVVGENRAQVKGRGSINGVPGFEFKLTAYAGKGGSDRGGLRLEIWTAEGRVYDNRYGAADDNVTAGNTQPIGGGSIVIHAR